MAGDQGWTRVPIPSTRTDGYEARARARGSLGGLSRPAADRVQLGFRRGHRLADIGGGLHRPACVLAHLVERVARVNGRDVGLPTPRRKSKDTERRDDRRRSAAKQAVALAPARRSVAVAG